MELTPEDVAATLIQLNGDPSGQCAEYTEVLAAHFPELKRVRGFVTLRSGLRTPHWWLVKPDGSIFDPTAVQFDGEYFWHAGIAFYEPLDESKPEPTGKCHNCGGFIYDGHDTVCSRKCAEEYAAFCMGPIQSGGFHVDD